MLTVEPETIHPSLWRAAQLARGSSRTLPPGMHPSRRSARGGGWPLGSLFEMLVQQPGVGELSLLRPALLKASNRPIALIKPPHTPQAHALANWGIDQNRLMWSRRSASLRMCCCHSCRALQVPARSNCSVAHSTSAVRSARIPPSSSAADPNATRRFSYRFQCHPMGQRRS